MHIILYILYTVESGYNDSTYSIRPVLVPRQTYTVFEFTGYNDGPLSRLYSIYYTLYEMLL